MSLQQTSPWTADLFPRRDLASYVCGLLVVIALTHGLFARPAFAQSPSPESRQGAAEAYDKGVGAYLSGRYEDAARWFETAHRLSPAAAALQQAVRARLRGTNLAQAATLALELHERYPNHEKARAYAEGVLNQLASELVRVSVRCEDCHLTLDGLVLASHTFFVGPEGDHTVAGSFDTGVAQHNFIAGPPGSALEVPLVAPKAMRSVDGQALSKAGTPEPGTPQWRPLYAYIGAGATGALLAATIAAGIGANVRGSSYNRAARAWESADCPAQPLSSQSDSCQVLYDRAESRLDTAEGSETRTNVLLGATLITGVATAALAYFFTDWDEHDTLRATTISYSSRNAKVEFRMAF